MPVLLVTVISLAVNPVTDLEKVIGTSKVSAFWTPVGSVKLTVAIVVSKAIVLDAVSVVGTFFVPSVAAFAAIVSCTVPLAAVGEVIVAV